jgi:hypothetical protein
MARELRRSLAVAAYGRGGGRCSHFAIHHSLFALRNLVNRAFIVDQSALCNLTF